MTLTYSKNSLNSAENIKSYCYEYCHLLNLYQPGEKKNLKAVKGYRVKHLSEMGGFGQSFLKLFSNTKDK